MSEQDDQQARTLDRYLPKGEGMRRVFGALTLWIVVMSAIQGGWHALFVLLGLLLAAGTAMGIMQALSKDAQGNPWQFVLTCLVLATGFWFYFSGSYRSWQMLAWDVGGIAIGGMLGTAVVAIVLAFFERGQDRKTSVLSSSVDALPVCVVLMGWLAITGLTLWRQEPLPRDTHRFAAIGAPTSIVAAQASRWQPLRVGLALSGGGYRAAVYHAGALHALERLGIRANVLSTVSGGSIIGAYYALGGDPVAFKDAVAGGRFNLKRELSLLHNALRLPFPITLPIVNVQLFPWFNFSRRDVQAGLLRRTLFVDDESWRAPAPDQPALVIATTDLIFGQQVGLMPDGAVVIGPDRAVEAYRGEAWRPARDFSLAERVAMSGGFPVAFPAQPVSVEVRPATDAGAGARPMLLADGGIVDNSGFLMLAAVSRFASAQSAHNTTGSRMASDVFLISDAGAIFGVEPELGGFAQAMRAADISSVLSGPVSMEAGEVHRVSFSPHDYFLSSSAQFRLYNGQPDQFDGVVGTLLAFDPGTDFPASVLAEIVALLPAKSAAAGREALRRLQGARAAQSGDSQQWSRALSQLDLQQPCAPLAALPGLCDAFELRALVSDALAGQLAQFRTASTLDDLPSHKLVEHLFALGQLLVYLQWPRLEREMDAALAGKSG